VGAVRDFLTRRAAGTEPSREAEATRG
jgi:hypothetical protein